MARELTESGGRLPQPTEEVHLPPPAYTPAVVALGTWIALIGVTLSWYIVGIGVLIVGVALTRWIRQAREEMRELPLEH
jgi:type IV secretory pathway TrbD component